MQAGNEARRRWLWGAVLVLLATALRLAWVLAVPTVPVSDFAMYRESANYLSEFGSLDHGFIYMPGFVVLLAWIKDLGGDLLAQKVPGVVFGGLGAAGVYVLALRLEGLAVAVIATVIYALWPAGVAMASVVGTDVPAAALIMVALAALATLADRQPPPPRQPRPLWIAAVAFGAIMGLGAWIRAVTLPLTALGAGYWLAIRTPLRRAAALAAAGVGATLLVLAPWAVRHLRQSGALYFTDDHGGITALIGANPNSEGTYTRALNQLFRDVSGKAVLDEPHHEVDRAAYGLAKEWMGFEPAYTLGLAAKKAERLFDPEQRLLYWSVFRPGVLVGRTAAWFEARHARIGDAADAFGLAIVALALGGVGAAAVRRRWPLLSLLPFQLALAATYTVFFAEPRYRIPIEMLAFPFVALALVELARAARAAVAAARQRAWAPALPSVWALAAGLALVLAWQLGWPALVDGGARLRARHRWAVTEWLVDGRARPCMWRPAGELPAASPIEGAPNGLWLRAAGPGPAPVMADVALGAGPLPAGDYALHVKVEASGAAARFTVRAADGHESAAVAEPGHATALDTVVHHDGGRWRMTARLDGAGAGNASAWISDGSLKKMIMAPGSAP
jgi:4-amino-4-deoxy-L-arabinose transferase-like glycosyltransferase